ncbi:hypothetical protein GCM10023212_32760 [Luteolibacter yonseiensis]
MAVIGNRRYAGDADTVEDVKVEDTPKEAEKVLSALSESFQEVWKAIGDQMLVARKQEIRVEAASHSGGKRHGHREERKVFINQFFDETKPAKLGVLSSLAAGADQVGAEAALVVGKAFRHKPTCEKAATDLPACEKLEVELEAILPMAEKNYPGLQGGEQKEFRKKEAAKLRELLSEASQVIRLDGSYDSRHGAYSAAAELLLENSDLVIAAYDPQAEAGAGGTLETVRQALEREIPVLAMIVKETEIRIVLYRKTKDRPERDKEWEQAEGKHKMWEEGLKTLVSYLLAFPHSMAGTAEAGNLHGENAHGYERKRSLATAVERLELLQGVLPLRFPASSKWVRWLTGWVVRATAYVGERFAKLHAFERADLAKVIPGQKLERPGPFSGLGQWLLAMTPFAKKPAPSGNLGRVTMEPYSSVYLRASSLSRPLMAVYRGGFVSAFLLAACASSVAILSLGCSLLFENPWIVVLVGLGVLKLVIIAILLALEVYNHHQKWQEVAADFRYLAEVMQPMEYLAPLGASMPYIELPSIYTRGDPRQDWANWLFRAYSRATPSVIALPGSEVGKEISVVADDKMVDRSKQWISSQISYHKRNAVKSHIIENGLERLGFSLLVIVLAAVLALLAIEVPHLMPHEENTQEPAKQEASAATQEKYAAVGDIGDGTAEPAGAAAVSAPADGAAARHLVTRPAGEHAVYGKESAEKGKEAPSMFREPWYVVLLGVLAASLPALIGALGGICFQSEAKRLEQRSEIMVWLLDEHYKRVEILGGSLKQGNPSPSLTQPPPSRLLAAELRSAADLMVRESLDWRTLYRTHSIKAG